VPPLIMNSNSRENSICVDLRGLTRLNWLHAGRDSIPDTCPSAVQVTTPPLVHRGLAVKLALVPREVAWHQQVVGGRAQNRPRV
jgi:hypothetical protein